ncbi:hypothetical protein L7F22_024378 [Adiantum nelumboides]|nr:hypothetical protein [Adiantum nelumboides]
MTTDHEPPSNSTGRFLGLMPEKLADRHQQFMAIEFDTFQNLQAEIHDPSASHIGIDISSLASVHAIDTAADPSHPLYLYNNYTITAWVSYNASTHLIQVWATNSSQPNERPPKPILSSTHNLSRIFENHAHIYVGMTAASGNNSEAATHSWNFTVVGEQNRTSPTLLKILIGMYVSIIAVALAVANETYTIFQRKMSAQIEERRRAAFERASVSVHRYQYDELKRAAQSFNKEREIGRGGFSSVYKGVLRDGTVVAIKKMKDGLVEADVVAKEVEIISKLKHRNLLELEGWCYEKGEALLVYKFMPEGSLHSYLYGEKKRSGKQLDSSTRFNIIVGVAAGLEYLHHGLQECVLHRDVKAANVLLTETMEAKLGDFGLARLIAHDETVSFTAAGTIGYMAPEVVHTGRVTEKVDVYSFGVLALEVACGRKAVNPLISSTYSCLVDWVWLQTQNSSVLNAIDPSLVNTLVAPPLAEAGAVISESEELQKWRCVLHLGLLCCQADPDMRPLMRDVHQVLKGCAVLPPPRSWASYPAPSPRAVLQTEADSAGNTNSTSPFFTLPSSTASSSQAYLLHCIFNGVYFSH